MAEGNEEGGTMRKLGLNFLVLIFAVQTITLCAQTTDRPKPWFSLSIEASDPSHPPTHYTADRYVVLVTYTNISDVDDMYSEVDHEEMLNMIVLRDGAPAEETDNMRALRKDRKFTESKGWSGSVQAPVRIKPGKSVTWPLPVGDYFDMTMPGTYTITVNRETFPHDLARSVTVWSNTIEIVVPKPGAETPQ
jgi:hypothetical protein